MMYVVHMMKFADLKDHQQFIQQSKKYCLVLEISGLVGHYKLSRTTWMLSWVLKTDDFSATVWLYQTHSGRLFWIDLMRSIL